jgi:EF hand
VTAVTSFERKTLSALLLLAGSLAFAGAAAAQYPEDPSRLTIALPPPGAITPPLANDPIGARIGRTAGTDATKVAASPDSKRSIVSQTMSERPIIPSKAELAAAAFKKLDAGGKGYVSKEDVRELSGFDKSFELADANKDGKLSPEEFRKAWANYTGRKSG